MGPFLPLHHPGSWACSMAYTHVELRNGKQCHSAAYCMCVLLCCISATKPDMFCHSVLLSVMFYLFGPFICLLQALGFFLIYALHSYCILFFWEPGIN